MLIILGIIGLFITAKLYGIAHNLHFNSLCKLDGFFGIIGAQILFLISIAGSFVSVIAIIMGVVRLFAV